MARTNVEPVEFYVGIGKRELVKRYASGKGLSMSEYVRQLVERDMRDNGVRIDLQAASDTPPERPD